MIRTLGTDFGHFFLLEQDGEVTLIDAGLSGYRDTLEPALAEMGRSLDDVKAIVLTHADPDHVGFAGELQRARGIPVYVHRADSDRTRQGRAKHAEGSPLAMLKMLRHAHSWRALRHTIANGGFKQPKVTEVVAFDDGDELDVPGRLRVIHTPGHTEGHCVLYAPSEDALFVGDAINNLDIVSGQPGAHLRASVRQHLHHPGIRIAVKDRGTGRANYLLRPRRPIDSGNPCDRGQGPRQTLTL